MNAAETERQAISDIIDTMPPEEKAKCLSMIRSLLMSCADPKTGETFTLALAFANTEMAVRYIAAGIVSPDGKSIMPNVALESIAAQKARAMAVVVPIKGDEDVKH